MVELWDTMYDTVRKMEGPSFWVPDVEIEELGWHLWTTVARSVRNV